MHSAEGTHDIGGEREEIGEGNPFGHQLRKALSPKVLENESYAAALALDTLIYGLLLILFIIYMPKGILGTLLEWREKKTLVPLVPAKAGTQS